MTGKENGAAALIKKLVHLLNPEQVVFTVHCIIHQEALCGKALKMDHVMNAVVKTVNEIRAKGLKHRQFRAFLEELDGEYKDLLYHCEVRWLSRGKVLERFFVLREQIILFLMEKNPNLKEKGGSVIINLMSDQDWLLDLAFLVDITQHLNMLNTKMQGRNQLLTALLEHVRAFRTKLILFRNQFEQGKFIHFRSMSSLVEMLKIETTSFKRYMDLLDVMMENFKQRFHDLDGRERSHDLFRDPFSDLAENFEDDPALQLEILDIQSCFTLKTSFRELSLTEFYKQINVVQYPKY